MVEYVGTSAVVTLQADGSVKVVAAPDSPVTAAHTAAEEPPLDMPPLE